MKIAVVGGGNRCRDLLNLIERHSFSKISPKIVAVADKKDDAPGLVKARENGIFVTNDYNDLFDRNDINLIMELTGDQDIYNDILKKKKKTVRAVAHWIINFLHEISIALNKQVLAKQRLKEQRARYDVIMNVATNENVMVIAPDCRILDINKNLLKKTGLTRDQAVGRYCYEVSHHLNVPCSGERHPCPLPQALKTQKPFRTTHIHPDKDNNELFFAVSCFPVFEDDEVIGVVEILRDVTRDVNIQKIMMQQDKLASIGRLAAGVAHEINNPMTTILTSVMLMQEDTDPNDPKYQELKTVVDETLRCSKIVTSLLDFARQMKPAKKMSNLRDIIVECTVLTRKQAEFNDVSIVEGFSEDLPLTNIDGDKIQQALINLTLNAIEATGPGGKVNLSAKFVPNNETFEIAICDSGTGISDENMDKIFDPFFTTKESGTGLGLAITLGIIEQHGGTIDVKSKLGQGTSFTIRLPLDQGNKDVHSS